MNKIVISLVVGLAIVAGVAFIAGRQAALEKQLEKVGLINGGANARKCIPTQTVAVAGMGNTIGNILATSSLRAYARISVGDNATNTYFLSFDQGAKAAPDKGLPLNHLNGVAGNATATPFIEFGLNTAFPYTGAVSAASETGTSTLLVLECVYSNN